MLKATARLTLRGIRARSFRFFHARCHMQYSTSRFHRCAPVLALAGATIALAFETNSADAAIVFAVGSSSGELIRYDSNDPVGTRTVVTTTLSSPTALVAGPDGNLYIGQSGNGGSIAPSIVRYEIASNTFQTVHTFGSAFDAPGGLAFQGSSLLVGRNPAIGAMGSIRQLTNALGGAVSVADYSNGGTLASSPAIAVLSSGEFIVSDQFWNIPSGVRIGSVKRFDAAGNYISTLVEDGTSGLFGPAGLATDGTWLFIASSMTGDILRTNLATGITTTFASTNEIFGAQALALLADGSLLVGSENNGRIRHFDANGTLLSIFETGLYNTAAGIAVFDSVVPAPSALTLIALGFGVRRRRR